jgi:transcriptional regulator with XRE-family HTH domain
LLSDSLGNLLRDARKHRGLSREQLALQAGVSPRLVAELERGQRPNVSLETALRLLTIAGVSVSARAPSGAISEIVDVSAPHLERAARAAQRRKTWTGRHVHLHDSGDDPLPVRSKSERLVSLAQVSKQSYALAAAARVSVAASTTKRRRR